MADDRKQNIEKSCYIYNDIWSDKNSILPEEVSIWSKIKIWFNCFVCGHDYKQTPNHKTSGHESCPYCINKLRCSNCNMCLENSCFRYKDIWSDKNNEDCRKIALNSNKKFWFKCQICYHDYNQVPNSKIKGDGCPYCANLKRCGECTMCLENSCFRYKDIWSDKNIEDCRQIAVSSGKNYWFNCLDCGHYYHQKPYNKTNNRRGCHYCSNYKRCGECTMCLENSCFRYKDIWSDKNIEDCRQIAISSSGKKYWFNCIICKNTYSQSLNDKKKGASCPYCVNKTELKVTNFLKEQNINFKRQFRIKNIKKYYDFYLPDFDLIIEIDGEQHFRQVSNWGCHEKTMKNDIEKMKTGIENSISFLRIYQPDIFIDKIDWKTILLKNLYKRTIPDISYFSSNSEVYDNHNFLIV